MRKRKEEKNAEEYEEIEKLIYLRTNTASDIIYAKYNLFAMNVCLREK